MSPLDLHSTTEEGAAGFERYHRDCDDRRTLLDATAGMSDRPSFDPYKGTCGGCEKPVSSCVFDLGGENGSCIHKGGPWHPACRAADVQEERK